MGSPDGTSSFVATALSGAGDAGKVGVAGSLALNLVTGNSSQAAILSGASVTLAGATADVNLAATDGSVSTATANSTASGGKVGVGASFAMNQAPATAAARSGTTWRWWVRGT